MAGALGSLSAAESAWGAPIAFVACGWFGGIAQTVCNLHFRQIISAESRNVTYSRVICGYAFVA